MKKRKCAAVAAVGVLLTACLAACDEVPEQQKASSESGVYMEAGSEEHPEQVSLTGEDTHPYISITYGRDNPDNTTGRDMVFYTYDMVTRELKQECVIPFDSQYACGVVSKAKNTVYYSGRSEPDNLSSCDGLWAYNIGTGKSELLENKNWSYNSIIVMESDRLLVMAMTKEHPILPAVFDLRTKTFTYMPDVNGEPFDLYNCGPTELGYNYGTGEIVSIYQNEDESYQSEYLGNEIPINTYISVASRDMVKDPERTFSLSLKTEDDVMSATQVSENELLVVIDHMDWDTLDTESRLYSLVYENGEGTLTPADSPYPHSRDWKTVDGGKTFYFMLQSEDEPERGLYSYYKETGELTPILPGDPESSGHVVNFSILAPGS